MENNSWKIFSELQDLQFQLFQIDFSLLKDFLFSICLNTILDYFLR